MRATVLTLLAAIVAAGCHHAGHVSHTPQPEQHSHAHHQGDGGDLRTIMIDLASNMNGIHAGMWLHDLDRVGREAGAIAAHPHVSAMERQRIQEALGKDFARFVAGDRRVHDAAARLAEAAAHDDMDAALLELSQVQSGCVSCHDAFRLRLRR